MSGETNQMPWNTEAEKLWQEHGIPPKEVLVAIERACRKFADQETAKLKGELEAVSQHLELLRGHQNKILEDCESFRRGRNSCEKQLQEKIAEIGILTTENMRLAAEHKQCHEQNSKLISELVILKSDIRAAINFLTRHESQKIHLQESDTSGGQVPVANH